MPLAGVFAGTSVEFGEWYAGGGKKSEGAWRGGLMQGRWQGWREDGTRFLDESFERGEPVAASASPKASAPGTAPAATTETAGPRDPAQHGSGARGPGGAHGPGGACEAAGAGQGQQRLPVGDGLGPAGHVHARGEQGAGAGGFCMDLTEVTIEAFAACVKAGRCSAAGFECGAFGNRGKPGREQHPVNCAKWSHADGFCRAAARRPAIVASLSGYGMVGFRCVKSP